MNIFQVCSINDEGHPIFPHVHLDALENRIAALEALEVRRPAGQAQFVAPSVEEVAAFINAQGYQVDAARFVAYYASKGWKIGGSAMTDWKSACYTWHTRWVDEHGGGEAPRPPRTLYPGGKK